MFMFILFLYLFIVASTEPDDVSFGGEYFEQLLSSEDFRNGVRNSQTKFPMKQSKCESLGKTEESGYVVMLLFRTSGRFMGMGGIIDKNTVITAEQTLKIASGVPSQILVLAGYRSPWWGKNSQVRQACEMVTNDYELGLVEVEPPWTFNSQIYPINLKKTATLPDDHYLDDFLVYGIPTNTDFSSGDKMPKKLIYTMVKHTMRKENNCGKQYPDLKEPFNSSIEQCLFPNATFCAGCVGSPVVVIRKKSLIRDLAGVVVRSNCLFEIRDLIMVKVPVFSYWIKYNSLLA